ncbi:MAG TPA: response regulator [Candidatus Acidoferrales bacterium]|jgi:CheY-like chemotaxis protein|nr:response regulator [Candidatus Acidoferrales bacterium]
MSTVLLVEDNENNRDFLRRRLERRGYAVVIAHDGEEGYSLAESEKPDVILMDISLPGMDGWKVTELLKANEATQRIPVIILTAHALISDRAKAFELGCAEYETKPVDFARLTEKIDSLVPAKRLA